MKTTYKLRFHWGISRSRNTFGYTICSLYVNGKRVAACNGGGYDMQGTVLGSWIASAFPDKLRKLKQEFYGLTFHDPKFNPDNAEVPGTNQTVLEREKAGESIGLERYQAFYRASSKIPTKTHIVPEIDGACGMSAVERILEAIKGKLERIDEDIYIVTI